MWVAQSFLLSAGAECCVFQSLVCDLHSSLHRRCSWRSVVLSCPRSSALYKEAVGNWKGTVWHVHCSRRVWCTYSNPEFQLKLSDELDRQFGSRVLEPAVSRVSKTISSDFWFKIARSWGRTSSSHDWFMDWNKCTALLKNEADFTRDFNNGAEPSKFL